MTDKERLEKVDEIVSDLYNDRIEVHGFVDDSIEQAERAKRMESLYRIEKECSLDLLARNKRYREALESIQDIQQWNREQPDYEVMNIVNKALEDSK